MASDIVTEFWKKHYLGTFIADGGSKVKFLTGAGGAGKTSHLREYIDAAAESGYKTVHISGKTTWLHDFKEIFVAIFNAVDFDGCIKACAGKIIAELGYSPDEIPAGVSFADYLQAQGSFDPLTKREIRNKLSEMFFKNTWIDNNFAICSALLVSGEIGYPTLEPAAKELLSMWLRGMKEARVAALRKLGLSPSRITKYNARHMLRSLIEVVMLAGHRGLAVAIDDLDILAETSALEEIRYTKMRREDSYESIRELIDGIDTFSHLMVVFAFDKILLEDESKGLKSYQALWMRVQNEIVSDRINGFADIIDLDAVNGYKEAIANE
ncbi:MAG: ATP-binding protein [Clostridiales Family XIII bacterium]|jgi:hypothetical protein|nr:ATP-binding protein [Clostridiales Family XIII bacterium]